MICKTFASLLTSDEGKGAAVKTANYSDKGHMQLILENKEILVNIICLQFNARENRQANLGPVSKKKEWITFIEHKTRAQGWIVKHEYHPF